MATFREYLEDNDFVSKVLNEFNDPTNQVSLPQPKVWSAGKEEVLKMWKSLQPNIPLTIVPMLDADQRVGKSSYGEDGIRITGTWNFIAAVLGRMKELMSYESQNTKLRLTFRGIDAARAARPQDKRFVFYLNVERRKRPQVSQTPGLF